MKKLFALFALMSFFVIGLSFQTLAQEPTDTTGEGTEAAEEETTEETEPEPEPAAVEETEEVTEEGAEEAKEDAIFHQVVKDQFIAGGWEFMTLPLLCLVLGLAVSLERIISLTLATTNTKKIISKVESALQSGGVDQAKEITRNTRGPISSIFTQGLMRYHEGIDMVEKSVIAYGGVEMGKLEKGLTWISLFIAIAPMLGFMGTVIGMIYAFDSIAAAGDLNPSVVASSIKVALLTTVAGLIVAIILQIFYNYLTSKIESLVNQMENASISLIDLLVDYKTNYNK